VLGRVGLRVKNPDPVPSLVSGPTFGQCCRVTSAVPLIACSPTNTYKLAVITYTIHWHSGLPISSHPRDRIDFKIATPTYKTLSSGHLAYLRELISAYQPLAQLWSSNQLLLTVPGKSHNWLARFLLYILCHLGRHSTICYRDASTISSFKNGHILRHESLSGDIVGRMLGKATRGRKRLQMLSDVTSKRIRGLEDGSCRQEWMDEETVINLPLRAEDRRKKNPLATHGAIWMYFDWLTGWLTDWPIDWMIDWLIDWFIYLFVYLCMYLFIFSA